VTEDRLTRRVRWLARRALNRLRTAFRLIQSERFARALIAFVDLAVTVYQGMGMLVT